MSGGGTPAFSITTSLGPKPDPLRDLMLSKLPRRGRQFHQRQDAIRRVDIAPAPGSDRVATTVRDELEPSVRVRAACRSATRTSLQHCRRISCASSDFLGAATVL
jgi:hypothetical protein